MMIAVFFTKEMSLVGWDHAGILKREIEFCRALIICEFSQIPRQPITIPNNATLCIQHGATLDFTNVSVSSINDSLLMNNGNLYNSGTIHFGEIKKWQVEEGELDGLLGLTGEPLRPIPEALYKGDTSAVRADTGWQPAYWHPANRAICYVPEIH